MKKKSSDMWFNLSVKIGDIWFNSDHFNGPENELMSWDEMEKLKQLAWDINTSNMTEEEKIHWFEKFDELLDICVNKAKEILDDPDKMAAFIEKHPNLSADLKVTPYRDELKELYV